MSEPLPNEPQSDEPALEEQSRTLHDRLFKDLLHRFLPSFLRTFLPEEAAQLNFATLRFLNNEQFANFPRQALRITDTVVEVETLAGEPEVILVHVEVESRRRGRLPRRMFEYYGLLRLLEDKPVLPIAVVLERASVGLGWQAYREQLFGHDVLQFAFVEVGLSKLTSENYVDTAEAAVAALAVLMQPRDLSNAEVKLKALQRVVESDLSNSDKYFLVDLIETYVPNKVLYDAKEEIMLNIMEITESWSERIARESREEGKREIVLRQLTLKFGELPDEFVERVQQIEDDVLLNWIADQLIAASTLSEISLDQSNNDQSNGYLNGHSA